MSIKNLKMFNKIKDKMAVPIVFGTVISITTCGSIFYYTYENKEQIDIKIDNNKIFTDEDGKLKYYFDVGEHIIKISRNDAYYHKSENIEGYTIKDVEINGWRDNNQITYVNTVPVIATITDDKNLKFNDFGEVIKDKTFVLKK